MQRSDMINGMVGYFRILGNHVYAVKDCVILQCALDGKVLMDFKGHTQRVYKLAIYGEYLFSASDDLTIRKWDFAGNCLGVFLCSGTTRKFYFYYGYMFTLAHDTFFKWNLTGKLLQTFAGHQERVIKLLFHENNVFSYSWDGTISKWDLSGKCLKTAGGPNHCFFDMLCYRGHIYNHGENFSIQKLDLDLNRLISFPERTSATIILFYDNYMFSCRFYGGIVKYSIDGKETLIFGKCGKNTIEYMAIHGELLYSVSNTHDTQVWDLDGNCIMNMDNPRDYINKIFLAGPWIYGISSVDNYVYKWNMAGKLVGKMGDHSGIAKFHITEDRVTLYKKNSSNLRIYLLGYSLSLRNSQYFTKREKKTAKAIEIALFDAGLRDEIHYILCKLWNQ